jgi:WD40 repeat protein
MDDVIKPEYMYTPSKGCQVPSKVEFKISAHKKETTCVVFNAMGEALATGGGDNSVKIWNLSTGKIAQTLNCSKSVSVLDFSIDNEFLAACTTDHKANLFKLKTMRNIFSFQGHKETINACKFSFSKKSLYTGSADRTIKQWDIEKQLCAKTVSYSLFLLFRWFACPNALTSPSLPRKQYLGVLISMEAFDYGQHGPTNWLRRSFKPTMILQHVCALHLTTSTSCQLLSNS